MNEERIDEINLKELYLKFQSNLKYRITAKEIASLVSDLHGFDREYKLKNLKRKLNNSEFFNIIKKKFKEEYRLNISKLFIISMIDYFLQHEHNGELTNIIYNKIYADEVIKYVIRNQFKTQTA